MSSGVAVSLRDVAKTYDNGVAALGPIDLTVRHGEFVSLLGPSGCGKSTALRLIAGLASPTAGRVETSAGDHRGHRIGFVFQEPTLMPWATVRDNVRLPFRIRGTRTDADSRVSERKSSPRNYSLLEEANTRPRTTYLARIETGGEDG